MQRKLRGAQRVAGLQQEVERLYAHADALAAACPSPDWWRRETPEERATSEARQEASNKLLELHGISPKRALAVAHKLGMVKPAWFTQLPEQKGHRVRGRGVRYKGYGPSEAKALSAGPLPVKDAATQRQLAQAVERVKQARRRAQLTEVE